MRPYRTVSPLPIRVRTGGLFSAALSLESPPPGVTRRRVSVEPGLSSPASGGGHPAVWQWDSMGPSGLGQVWARQPVGRRLYAAAASATEHGRFVLL